MQGSLPEPPLWHGRGWASGGEGKLHGALGGGLPHVSLRCPSLVDDNRGQVRQLDAT